MHESARERPFWGGMGVTRLPKGTRITWLGHATFAVTTPAGKTVVFDPFIEGNPTFPAGGRKHLEHVDLILVSHAHNDHMGDAASLSRATGAPIVCVHEISIFLAGQGVQAVGMNKSGTTEAGGVRVTMVGADHSSGYVDDSGRLVFGGEAAGFVLHVGDGEGEAVYHAGDTGLFGDMALIGELYHPSVALLPIGGHYTMGPREAAKAARLLAVDAVVPMHYGTFPPLTGRPDALRAALAGTGVEVTALEPGQTVTY
jgi:L-ascorbate metabolism protein UlaG (beta-lactamase superfamily)